MLDYVYDVTGNVVHHFRVRSWCLLPYVGHPHGCPNYGKQDTCPPSVSYVTDVFDLSRKMYIVVHEFDLAAHVERLREIHPEWSERQLRNVLYWQSASKRALKLKSKKAMLLYNCSVVSYRPEGLGVNMYLTARRVGVRLLAMKNITINRHISLIGSSK